MGKKNIIIIGAGGFSREVIQLAEDCGRNVVGILDDDTNAKLDGRYPQVIGSINKWKKYIDCEFIITVANPRLRKKIAQKMLTEGKPSFANLVHPSVVIDKSVELGNGCIICKGVIITVDIQINDHVIININSTIGHDTIIQNFVTISPLVAISGNVHLHELVEVGTGASVRQGLKLMPGSMLGMGGVAIKNISENDLFLGNPARKYKTFN
jgi:sugar O-acyltransferase (sialic acid O-acetyltransferase NeuD family)